MADPVARDARHRLRRWWHCRLRALTPAAADDLIDGLDLADHPIRLPPIRLLGNRRRSLDRERPA